MPCALLPRIKRIALFGNMHSARCLLAMAESIWFFTLAWPGDTFDRPTYAAMAEIASEPAWAVIFLITAAIQWTILLIGDYHSKWPVRFATWNMCLWWVVVISMYLSVYPPPAAISGELALAIGASWVFVRSGYITKEHPSA
jgi:hypothetical protein